MGTGKPIYFLLDVALARFFGAPFERQIATWLINEQLSQRSYRDDRATKLSYYRTAKGSLIHLVIENDKVLMPVKILSSEHVDEREFLILKAFRAKAENIGKHISCVALGAGRILLKEDKIDIYSWESVA